MGLHSILNRTLTVTEATGEGSDGHATTRVTQKRGNFFGLTDRIRNAQAGPVPADAVLAMLLPDGWGESWSLKPGDTIARDGRTVTVLSCDAVEYPRTGVVVCIEAVCG